MIFYGTVILLPLLIVIFLGYLFFAGRRTREDETGRNTAGSTPKQPRAQGREV